MRRSVLFFWEKFQFSYVARILTTFLLFFVAPTSCINVNFFKYRMHYKSFQRLEMVEELSVFTFNIWGLGKDKCLKSIYIWIFLNIHRYISWGLFLKRRIPLGFSVIPQSRLNLKNPWRRNYLTVDWFGSLSQPMISHHYTFSIEFKILTSVWVVLNYKLRTLNCRGIFCLGISPMCKIYNPEQMLIARPECRWGYDRFSQANVQR